MADNKQYIQGLDEYIRQGELQKQERGRAWQTAIGLQDVDGLKTSSYLLETARKHIEGDIWELRPLRERVFFVAWYNNSYVLLHHFTKKTQKTPKDKIKLAKQRLKEM